MPTLPGEARVMHREGSGVNAGAMRRPDRPEARPSGRHHALDLINQFAQVEGF